MRGAIVAGQRAAQRSDYKRAAEIYAAIIERDEMRMDLRQRFVEIAALSEPDAELTEKVQSAGRGAELVRPHGVLDDHRRGRVKCAHAQSAERKQSRDRARITDAIAVARECDCDEQHATGERDRTTEQVNGCHAAHVRISLWPVRAGRLPAYAPNLWPAPRSTTIAVSEVMASSIRTTWNFFMVRLPKDGNETAVPPWVGSPRAERHAMCSSGRLDEPKWRIAALWGANCPA